MVKVTILNWEKYNPRNDVKRPSWFRVENSLLADPDFFSFNNGEMLGWIYILSLASKANSGSIFVNFDHAQVVCRIKEKDLRSALEKLEQLSIITVHVTDTSRTRNADDTHLHATNERTNITNEHYEHYTPTRTGTGESVSKFVLKDSHIEYIYALYPRKEGKASGFKKAKSEIKTENDLENLRLAVEKYSAHVSSKGIEPKFIKHFSTFMGCWQDWLDENHGSATASGKSDPFALIRSEGA